MAIAQPHRHQLRSFIAPAAPATRAPCDGTEPAIRVEFGFTPKWYRTRCGIDFSEQWHLDPLYRRETLVQMRRELNRSFPELALGGADPDSTPATLDGVHGALTMALVFGVPAEYYADNWPAAKHAYLARERIAAIEVPDLADVPVIAEILEQMEIIEKAFGRIEGYVNWQGVLNTAYRVRGPEILTDMMVDPPFAHYLFDVIARTMIAGMRLVYARQRQSGVEVRHATVSNCLVNMVSPEAYREHLMPYDQMISDAFEFFGIHNCAWNVDPYIEDYAQIRPDLGYVDMGIESDLVAAKRLCPVTRRAIMYTPKDLVSKPLDTIRTDLERIGRELGPCDIVMADIEDDTPDERVLAFARLAEEAQAAVVD
ncbi:MAG TPA: uroporphyrinogen decarboxylase family protein [Candidatus Hydrogenedentes bacterium]|nr:uroporphyrinogen decarboxylase family protein [Candidatus Hydrogenedentota bacterium]HPG69185.1 uroporphyrinogen decarboxylase family protein [Candidatus Hydrogenedentota bacterium]